MAWRLALGAFAVQPGCWLVLGLVAAGVFALADATLRWCGIDNWQLGACFWVACVAAGAALLWLLIVPPLGWWCARRNGYVITNRRALLVLSKGNVLSYPPAMMRNVIVHRFPDGHGQILFEYRVIEGSYVSSDSEGGFGVVRATREVRMVGFLELADVDTPKRVLEALLGRELQYDPAPSVAANSYHFPL